MTRTQKIERIKKYRPYLFRRFEKRIPNLVNNPEEATDKDIGIYNFLLKKECANDPGSEQFAINFSF